jgi:hypothetical protein
VITHDERKSYKIAFQQLHSRLLTVAGEKAIEICGLEGDDPKMMWGLYTISEAESLMTVLRNLVEQLDI